MKKSFLVLISVVCAIVICSSFVFDAGFKSAPAEISDVSVTVEDTTAVKDNLLSMLNHNFVYGSDFDNADSIVNLSVNALLGLKGNDDFIKTGIVTDFVNNMYGVDVVDFRVLNAGYPQKDGYVFVAPSGFTEYKHSNIRVSYNEDGTISAVTDVRITGHDGTSSLCSAESLFVPNDMSAFGYNIIYSEILSGGVSL